MPRRKSLFPKPGPPKAFKYKYNCPNCGTYLELKMRVTQTKRRCPQCGTPVTPEEIDRQRHANSVRSCLGDTVVVVILVAVALALVFFLSDQLTPKPKL